MYEIKESTIKKSLRPFDIVKLKNGDVAYIKEVSVNTCQETLKFQISYSITLVSGTTTKCAWYSSEDLEYQCNLMQKIAEDMTHPFGSDRYWVSKLMWSEREKRK